MADNEMNDWNAKVIDDFRANAGKVGGQFSGVPVALVHHVGAKTGTARVNPLMYQPGPGDDIYVFASKGGAPDNPDWFHNLVANPTTTVEVGTRTHEVTARVLEGDERTAVWERQKAAWPQFAEYEESAQGREIPVVALET